MSWIIGVWQAILSTYIEMAPYLLLGLAFAGILHVLFDKDLVVRHLGANSTMAAVKAALLGVPLPLCSCGVIPTALSLRRSRASQGATMSFLISTPQTGVDSIIATWGMLGPVFAVFRPFASLVMGVAGGIATNTFLRDTPADTAGTTGPAQCVLCGSEREHTHGPADKIKAMVRYAYGTFLDDISSQLLVGIVLSGLISFLMPDDFFDRFIGNEFLSMMLMIAGGIPLYVCATASIPIAAALMMKGLSPGAAFVFLAVGPATNAATITVVGKAMGGAFVAVYLSVMSAGAVAAGYALNAAFGLFDLPLPELSHPHHHESVNWWSMVFAAVFTVTLLGSIYRKVRPYLRIKSGQGPAVEAAATGTVRLTVEGMTCSRCADHVTGAIRSVRGVTGVRVDVKTKSAVVSGAFDDAALLAAVADAGYTAAVTA